MCRLEKFHLPLRPNLKDWNMMTLNKKWMRLMVLVGCAALTASCKQAPVAQMEAEYTATVCICIIFRNTNWKVLPEL